jgi:hypothetical protein
MRIGRLGPHTNYYRGAAVGIGVVLITLGAVGVALSDVKSLRWGLSIGSVGVGGVLSLAGCCWGRRARPAAGPRADDAAPAAPAIAHPEQGGAAQPAPVDTRRPELVRAYQNQQGVDAETLAQGLRKFYLQLHDGELALGVSTLLSDMAAMQLYRNDAGPAWRTLELLLSGSDHHAADAAMEIQIWETVLAQPRWKTHVSFVREVLRVAVARHIVNQVVYNLDPTATDGGQRLGRWTGSQPGTWHIDLILHAQQTLFEKHNAWVAHNRESAMFRFCLLMKRWAQGLPAAHDAKSHIDLLSLPANSMRTFGLNLDMNLDRRLWAPIFS